MGESLPGDHRRGVPPVPIPNTTVKPSAANGSRTLGPARVGCCQVYGPVLRKKKRAFFSVNSMKVLVAAVAVTVGANAAMEGEVKCSHLEREIYAEGEDRFADGRNAHRSSARAA